MSKIAYCWLCVLALFYGSLAGQAAEATARLDTTILRPDGTPAAGAQVLVRVLRDEDGSLQEDRQLVADAQGHVATTVEFDRQPNPLNPVLYAVIDVEGCALTLVNIPIARNNSRPAPIGSHRGRGATREVPDPLTLRANYPLTGIVRDAQQQPVAGADVVIVTGGGGGFSAPSRYNYPSAGIATPAMRTTTDAEGRFTLRGIDMAGALNSGGIFQVAVLATQGDRFLLGDAYMNSNLPVEKLREAQITLVSTRPLHGEVVDASTQQPVAGAWVTLVPRPGAANRQPLYYLTAVTDATGHYQFPGVPPIDELVAEAHAPGYGVGWTVINAGGNTRPVDGAQVYRMALRPMVTIRGTVRAADTGQTFIAPPFRLIAYYDEGYRGLNLITSSRSVEAPVATDGTFTLTVPEGNCRLRLSLSPALIGGLGAPGISPQYAYFPVEPATMNIAAGNPVTVSVTAPAVLFLRLVSETPLPSAPVVMARTGDKEERCTTANGFYAIPYAAGQPLTVRVEHNGQELLPWTPVTPDAHAWLVELKIP